MKNLLFVLMLITSSLCAQDAFLQVSYGGNYGVDEGVAIEGITTGVEGHLVFEQDETFGLQAGLAINYFSLSNTIKTAQGTLYLGVTDRKNWSGGLLANYINSSSDLGMGMWLQLDIPVNDQWSVIGRGQVSLAITDTEDITPNITYTTLQIGAKYNL